MPLDQTNAEPPCARAQVAELMIEVAGGEMIRSFTEDGERGFIVLIHGGRMEFVGVDAFFHLAQGAMFASGTSPTGSAERR
ncbi:hypothetical protein [Rubellimicrobium arenae]|uniref:hypothetical protein n=1 Tax=Rubellimicrobium arenae TaxID=2817372 RepID=UPI001B303771|nr:hypothetical protein [Rubellimicrobium arenae]